MINDNNVINKKAPHVWGWVLSWAGGLFIFVGIYFLFAAIIDITAPPELKEPFSPVLLPLISIGFLAIGTPFIIIGIKRIKHKDR